MTDLIRSASHVAVKRVRAVAKGRDPQFVILEGSRLIEEGLASGLQVELLLLSPERAEYEPRLRQLGREPSMIDGELLNRIAPLKNSPGVLAVCKSPEVHELAELPRVRPEGSTAPLLLVTAGITDPGNLGALVRSAEAAGAAALVHVQNAGVGLWNPRALRGSMGSLLRFPVFGAADRSSARSALESHGYQLVRPATRGGKDYQSFDWSPPTALWVESETGEAEAAVMDLIPVTIPMAGSVESLNVTVASSILLFAAGRLR